ncbi:hypothetical protein [Bacillus timonensis]|uniref:hypothetical protein n=1 Tax=Bacillus timonensis TaxID=1033734 RepID=UPI0004753F7F|nr:hypothetical protein [Bacillus timonensis]
MISKKCITSILILVFVVLLNPYSALASGDRDTYSSNNTFLLGFSLSDIFSFFGNDNKQYTSTNINYKDYWKNDQYSYTGGKDKDHNWDDYWKKDKEKDKDRNDDKNHGDKGGWNDWCDWWKSWKWCPWHDHDKDPWDGEYKDSWNIWKDYFCR